MREGWPEAGESTTRRTGRWRGLAAAAVLACLVGIFLRQSAVVLAAAVAVALAGYPRVARPPVARLAVDRSVDDADTDPGDPVAVTLTVTNEGARLPTLRLVDGVPESLRVTEGSPARLTSLGPGESTTLSYTVESDRGSVAFDAPLAVTRDPAGVVERVSRPDAGGDGAVVCVPRFEPLDAVPLADRTAPEAGRRRTTDAGSGVAFHVLRDHRRGDPLSRIAWARWAKTGELATVEYQAERAATVVLLVDTRPAARVAPAPDGTTALQRSLDAAARLFATLDDAGHRVGVATLDDDRRWLAPGRGRTHRARARDLLTDDDLLSGDAASFDPTEAARWLAGRAPTDAQVLALSPLCDDAGREFLVRLAALDVPVTVCSPDPTATDTTGRRLARLERRRRLSTLRGRGLSVLDWPADRPLSRAVARGGERT